MQEQLLQPTSGPDVIGAGKAPTMFSFWPYAIPGCDSIGLFVEGSRLPWVEHNLHFSGSPHFW